MQAATFPDLKGRPQEKEKRKNATRLIGGGIALFLGATLATIALLQGLPLAQESPQVLDVPDGRRPVLGFEVAPSLRPDYRTSLTEGLKHPLAVAASPAGEVFVADAECRCVRVFDGQGALVSTLGKRLQEGQMEYPVALALDTDGILYVSDLEAGKILQFWKGRFVGTLSKGDIPKKITAPAGIAFYEGLIYINDLAQHQVFVFRMDSGALVKTVGAGKGTDSRHMSYPNFSLPLISGNLLVADSNNNRLLLFDRSGDLILNWPGPLNVPRGIAQAADGHIHVANTLSGRIEVFSLDGLYMGGYDNLGGQNNNFGFPNGLAIQGNTLYVADRVDGRVQIGVWPEKSQAHK